ncbi:MAG: glycerophosphodiester phosphodiesterase [Bacteroidia bacterium]|nr:glycerophosphodiester phosphodiesterase [Bacteroidia bacterium]
MSSHQPSKIKVHGHRGCRALFPENTLPAFEKAIDLGVDAIELDIAITKDNEVVVSHEPFMSRTICQKPNGQDIPESEDMMFNLYKMSHAEIKAFDCGSKEHPSYPEQIKMKAYKPLLNEVFDLVISKGSQVRFNIEIKSKLEYYGIYTPHPNEYVALVLRTIKSYDFNNRCNLQSFDLDILEEIKCQDPDMTIALLIDENECIEDKLKKLSFKPDIISPYFKLLTKAKVKLYQSQNYRVIPWTINEDTHLKRTKSFGVNAIITDYPHLLIELLKQETFQQVINKNMHFL